MWSGGVEPRTFSGGCHHTLPLMNETIRDSPATHSHPVESISFSEDVPIEFDCNNDEHGIDKNVNFKTISDFKRAHQNNFVFIHVNVNSLGTNLHICKKFYPNTELTILQSVSPKLMTVFPTHNLPYKDTIYLDKIIHPPVEVSLYMWDQISLTGV